MASRKAKFLLSELNRQVNEMLPEDERKAMEQKRQGRDVVQLSAADSRAMQRQQLEREERHLEDQRIRESRQELERALELYQRTRSRQRVRS